MIVNNNRWIIFISFFVVFISCRLGKEYQRPSLDLPEKFNNISFSDTSSIADISWKSFFTDTVLQNLIQRGITYNHNLLIALKQIDISHAKLKQSQLLQLPELNFQMTGQYNYPSKNSLSGISTNSFLGKRHLENYLAVLNISWEADVWQKLRQQKEATLAEYLSTYEGAKAVQTQVIADIAQSYFNLVMLDKQLEIAHRNLALSDSFLKATQLLRDAGIVTTLAVEQAASQRQSTALLIPQLEQETGLQENALQVLTGQLPATIFRRASLNEFSINDNFSAGLPASIVSRRPDVRSNEMALIVANALMGVAEANIYPALNITAGTGWETFKASNWFQTPNSLFGLASGAITQPIFKRRQLKTQYEVARLQKDQAVIRFRQSVLNAIAEVSDALVQVDKLNLQEQIATAQTDTLQRAIFSARLLFRSDLANYLEVITAQGNALQAELNLASIRRQRLSAIVELYRALGGGWK